MAPIETPQRAKRTKRPPPGIVREDSDDELGLDDHPWEWVYADSNQTPQTQNGTASRKRKRTVEGKQEIIGARMGSFHCSVGDTVLLKAEGTGEAWVGIICGFLEDDEGDKVADFMWFSSEREIRNKQKKRTDNVWVRSLPEIAIPLLG